MVFPQRTASVFGPPGPERSAKRRPKPEGRGRVRTKGETRRAAGSGKVCLAYSQDARSAPFRPPLVAQPVAKRLAENKGVNRAACKAAHDAARALRSR